jgi:hypothetical protein
MGVEFHPTSEAGIHPELTGCRPAFNIRVDHLHRALIFASAAGVHRADRPPADQSGRDEIESLGRLFANEALLTAAVLQVLSAGSRRSSTTSR